MFVTLRHSPEKSVTGTDGSGGAHSDGSMLINNPIPEIRIEHDDRTVGQYGGLLYNCAPREVVGSVMYAAVSPYRLVVRAEPDQIGPVLGIIVSKPRANVCEVIHAGYAPVFRSLTPDTRYYLGPRGTLLAPPLDQANLGYIHYIGYSVYPDTLLVQPSYALLKRS